MSTIHRRTFLENSGRTVAGAAASGAMLVAARQSRAVAANEKIGLGFVGVGGRGTSLLNGFLDRDDCDVVAIADVNKQHVSRAQETVGKSRGNKPGGFEDLRKMYEDPSVDAVVIATPDHWHALATVWACQAGKHVYVEKPISNNPWEGRQAVEAARKYDRVVQSGLQNRSAPYNFAAREYIASGELGRVELCRVYNQKSQGPFRMGPPGAPPESVNWTLWNGPSTQSDFHQAKFNHWHDFWCYGGGDVTNDGVHQVDLARMLLGLEQQPHCIYTSGRPQHESDAEVPDTVITTFEYENLVMTFHQTLFTPYMLKTDDGIRRNDIFPHWPQNATRIEIFGTKGVMMIGRHGGGWQVFGRPKSRQPVVVAQQYGRFPDPEHKEDWFSAIRSQRRPNADIEQGHLSAALCHYANISYRTGNRQLQLDAASERFTNDDRANALAKPDYCKGFAIPESV